MFLATINQSKRLLHLSFIADVHVDELRRSRDDVVALINHLGRGFRLLTDLGRLESMAAECAEEIAQLMELCDQQGVESVVRVIPNPSKDIGLGILSHFHYSHRPRIVTCDTMVEAAKVLRL